MKRRDLALGAAVALALLAGAAWFGLRQSPSTVVGESGAGAVGNRPARSPPWTAAQVRDLLSVVGSADQEGLRPSDYDMAALQAAVGAGRLGATIDGVADAAALSLAHDYASGRIRNRHRFNWYIDDAGPPPSEMAKQIVAARQQGRLGAWLRGLLPTSPDYRALRDALAGSAATNPGQRDHIIANLERWRWLPRDFATGYQLYVNLPTYQLEVIDHGRSIASYRAVIGATDMPTPVLSAMVRQVIANPDWIVPPSIVKRSHLRPGASSRYIFSTRPDGTLRVRQKPGPGNALGRVKIEFPNRLAIYFHDTPSKSLFGASDRAFSHGCVRVQNVEALASSIVDRPDRFAAALQGAKTRSFRTGHPWRATIVYLTMVRGNDGGVSFLGDPYRSDEPLAAALEGRKRRPIPAPASIVPAPPTSATQPAAPQPPVPAETVAPVDPVSLGNDVDAPVTNAQP